MSAEVGRKCEACGQIVTNGATKVDGVASIKWGDRAYAVPPLNVRGWKFLRREKVLDQLNELQASGSQESEEWADLVVKVIHTAIRRNYPDMTEDSLEEMIDFSNIIDLLFAVTGRKMPVDGKDAVDPLALSQPNSPSAPAGAATSSPPTS